MEQTKEDMLNGIENLIKAEKQGKREFEICVRECQARITILDKVLMECEKK